MGAQTNVISLTFYDHDYSHQLATVVTPLLPQDVDAVVDRYYEERVVPRQKQIWFDTGELASRRSEKKRWADYELRLKALEDEVPLWHPGQRIVKHVRKHRKKIARTIQTRLQLVRPVIAGLPPGPQRRHCQRLLEQLESFPYVYYGVSDHTMRLHALGNNPHQFPRPIRKILFDGLIEADLKAAQLSIVAKLWDVSQLEELLREPAGVWVTLAAYVGVDAVIFKPLFKRTVYSIVFGMSRRNLVRDLVAELIEGMPLEAHIALEHDQAQRLLKHPALRALLNARQRQIKTIEREKGAFDAYCQWQDLADKRHSLSILAYVVQSHEMYLMEPVLDVLEKQPQLYLISWLHDGVTLKAGNESKADRYHRQLEEAVNKRVGEMGYVTQLEIAEG